MENIIQKLLGVKYKWWYDGSIINGKGPFYYENKGIPSIDIIKSEGINCAGFINLIIRFLKLSYPMKVVELMDGLKK